MDFPDVGNLILVEIVIAQYDDIPELAFLDRAEFVLLLEEPAVGDRIEADGFFARDLLTGVDQLSRRVLARDHVIDHVPWIQRRDLRRIRSGADMDAAVDDRPQRRGAGPGATHINEREDPAA